MAEKPWDKSFPPKPYLPTAVLTTGPFRAAPQTPSSLTTVVKVLLKERKAPGDGNFLDSICPACRLYGHRGAKPTKSSCHETLGRVSGRVSQPIPRHSPLSPLPPKEEKAVRHKPPFFPPKQPSISPRPSSPELTLRRPQLGAFDGSSAVTRFFNALITADCHGHPHLPRAPLRPVRAHRRVTLLPFGHGPGTLLPVASRGLNGD